MAGATMESVQRAVERSAELFSIIGQATSDGVGITRASYGEGENIAHDVVADEARALGLDVATDAALNLRMNLAGNDRSAASVLIGSHFDCFPALRSANRLRAASIRPSRRQHGAVLPREVTALNDRKGAGQSTRVARSRSLPREGPYWH